MKIAIVVQGRFHAFHLARALITRGHDVTVLTNYPKWAARRFGLDNDRVHSFWGHGLVSRGVDRLAGAGMISNPTAWLLSSFGSRAAAVLSKQKWDVVHLWSGAAEEALRGSVEAKITTLMRGSAHIREQRALLEEEEQRVGSAIDKPDEWTIAREEREYRLADQIVTLSTFARQSFLSRGFTPEKVLMIPLGADTAAFKASADVVKERTRRILAGEPLRILYVGTLSARKGVVDIARVLRILPPERFRFRFVGPVMPEAEPLLREFKDAVEFVPKQPEASLPGFYEWGDVFFFPTIEDGFAAVLAQAQANGLPLLTTTNCSGPDIVTTGKNGWVLPVRSPDAYAERLEWCDAHREDLATMVREASQDLDQRDWNDVAADFEATCMRLIECQDRPDHTASVGGRR